MSRRRIPLEPSGLIPATGPDPGVPDPDAPEPELGDVRAPTGVTSTSEPHHEGDPGVDPRKANPHELMRRERGAGG